VGNAVGASVGDAVGDALGSGVGAPTETRRTTPVADVVAAVETVTFLDDLYTDVTVVPIDTPVPDTDAPRVIAEASLTDMLVDPRTTSADTVKTEVVYVGERVGEAEGAMLGEAVGAGVGLLFLYVGSCVGA